MAGGDEIVRVEPEETAVESAESFDAESVVPSVESAELEPSPSPSAEIPAGKYTLRLDSTEIISQNGRTVIITTYRTESGETIVYRDEVV